MRPEDLGRLWARRGHCGDELSPPEGRQGSPNTELRGGLLELLGELIVNTALDIDTRARAAGLSMVEAAKAVSTNAVKEK